MRADLLRETLGSLAAAAQEEADNIIQQYKVANIVIVYELIRYSNTNIYIYNRITVDYRLYDIE